MRQDFLQGLSTQPAGLQLLFGLLCGFPSHQSLCLGQEVGNKDLKPCLEHTSSETAQDNLCFMYSVV